MPSSVQYGTGKTTFSLDFVWEGLKAGERVIYISLEEREDRLILYMKQKDWEVEPYLNKSLYILKPRSNGFQPGKQPDQK